VNDLDVQRAGDVCAGVQVLTLVWATQDMHHVVGDLSRVGKVIGITATLLVLEVNLICDLILFYTTFLLFLANVGFASTKTTTDLEPLGNDFFQGLWDETDLNRRL
jgi:hypothetical protein